MTYILFNLPSQYNIDQKQISSRSRTAHREQRAAKQQRPLGLDLGALWSSSTSPRMDIPLLQAGQWPDDRHDSDISKGPRTNNQSNHGSFSNFCPICMFQSSFNQFQGIENVKKKSSVTEDRDCLEILSEAVK